jgi:ABC-2 type transport system permease protein
MKELLRATGVIARRDFTALVASKAFILFLLGPLLLVGMIVGASRLGDGAEQPARPPTIGLLLPSADADRLIARSEEARRRFGLDDLPRLVVARCGARDAAACLRADGDYQAILSGSIARPVLTGSRDNAERWQGRIALVVDLARQHGGEAGRPLAVRTVAQPVHRDAPSATRETADAAQIALFTLSILLSGMMLSNLVEEKSGKILEILAASVPVDAVFLGKLVAMLGVALVAAALWGAMGVAFHLLLGTPLPHLGEPPMGWPAFLLLAALYFIMAYSLMGSLMLGIGSLAGTVREVQMLSMPVTFGQLLFFFLAHNSAGRIGQPSELLAAIVPFSSPFAMAARAAQQGALWPHLLALAWQGLWVAATVRFGAALFRRNVIQSQGSLRLRFGRRG